MTLDQRMQVSFVVFGDPKPQPRQRFRTLIPAAHVLSVLGRMTPPDMRKWLTKNVRSMAYATDHDSTDWKNAIKAGWFKAGARQLSGPLHVDIEFVLPRPQSKIRKTKPNPRVWDTRKGSPGGDIDNFAKAVMDALNEIAYHDDSEVVSAYLRKLMADGDEPAHAVITLSEMDEYEEDYVSASEERPPF